ncbi:SOS response-associated peptidase [Paenibacillaceae bacterium]|nr:SOS response-associated peptidase [Paenibacillaceae bacterium]
MEVKKVVTSMCERFSLIADVAELQEKFQINKIMTSPKDRFNILPTQSIPVIIGGQKDRQLVEARWGLFPFWAKDSINADYDSVSRKPIFERIVKRQRCIVPCSGFYGTKTEGKVSEEVRFIVRDQDVFGMAGLFETRIDPRGVLHRTFTVVTTTPNHVVSRYNDRMPVIMDEEERESWLDPTLIDSRMLGNRVYAYAASRMHVYPVAPRAKGTLPEEESPEMIQEFGTGGAAWLKK